MPLSISEISPKPGLHIQGVQQSKQVLKKIQKLEVEEGEGEETPHLAGHSQFFNMMINMILMKSDEKLCAYQFSRLYSPLAKWTRLPTLQCWAKDWHTASPGNHSTSNLLRCMLNITGWQCRSSCRNIIHPECRFINEPKAQRCIKAPQSPSPLLCGWANSRRRGTCSPQSLGTLRRQPKNPAMARLTKLRCHCQGPQKKGTKGRYLLRHKWYKGARWFGLPDPVPTRCPWRSTKWAGCWFRTWPMSLQ